MTTSDPSDQTKPWPSSKKIVRNIYKEFFSQGDLEKAMGNHTSEMMDRERACVPKLQLDFLDTVALPAYELLKVLFPETSLGYESVDEGRYCWAALDDVWVSS